MRTVECIKWLWRASSGVRRYLSFNSLAGILHVCSSLTFVWICKSLVDKVVTGTDGKLAVYISGMIGCLLFQVIITAIEQRISNHSDIILKNRMRYLLFTKLMESKWNGKDKFHTGDTLNRVMEDVRIIAEATTVSIPAVIVASFQFIAAFVFLFTLEPNLAWIIPGLMVIALVMSKSYISKMRRRTKDIRSTEGNMQALMQESLQHRLVIHTLERTSYISDTLSQQQEGLRGQVLNKTGYSIFARSMIQ